MQFVYPSFLWALAAVSIPVIIHLFHFRRYKKVLFSDIRFLQQLQEQNKSKQKIKDWLILLCRVLLISCLVIAFAQPFIPIGKESVQKGNSAVALFVDNSFSMNGEGENGLLLEEAKEKARAVIKAHGAQEKFLVFTNALLPSEQRLLSKNEALQKIDEIEPATQSVNAQKLFNKVTYLLAQTQPEYKRFYCISDLQRSQFNLNGIEGDTSLQLYFLPVQNLTQNNVSIDSLYVEQRLIKQGEPFKLLVQLTNHGNDAIEGLVLKVMINGLQKALTNLNLSAKQQTVTELMVTLSDANACEGEAVITDYPITFDDKFYFSIKPQPNMQVMHIAKQPNKYINAVYEADEHYELTNALNGNINYGKFTTQQLIVLNELTDISTGLQTELQKVLDRGGNILLVPGVNQANAYNVLLQNWGMPTLYQMDQSALKLEQVNQQNELFKGVFKQLTNKTEWPKVNMHFTLNITNTNKGASVFSLNNGDALLWQSNVAKGKVFLLTSPLQTQYNSLVLHSIFVPLMLNMALPNAIQINWFNWVDGSKKVKLHPQNDFTDKLVQLNHEKQRLVAEVNKQSDGNLMIQSDGIQQAGWYKVSGNETKQPLGILAFNFKRTESGMNYFGEEEINKLTPKFKRVETNVASASSIQANIAQALNGKPLWRFFILAALIFALTEVALIRWLK